MALNHVDRAGGDLPEDHRPHAAMTHLTVQVDEPDRASGH